MNRHLFTAAFMVGALSIIWAGIGMVDSSFIALAMTAIIGAVYGCGAFELRRFREETSALETALTAVSGSLPDLDAWLAKVPPSLQNAVRLRIEGERVGLPGPAITPYLVGLLVMLGMLGTFMGMVVTLKGAVFALESTTDLEAIRSTLATPVKGLGLAFGTSVAGVAASAMLGLMSVFCRRERTQAAQLLDTKIATVLRRFSLAHQRNETYKALQQQSQALPQVAGQLQAMMAQLEGMNRQLGERLLDNQNDFHSNVKTVYTDLAAAVEKSLRDSLSRSAEAAGESVKPLVEAAMKAVAQETKAMHERMGETVQTQLDGMTARFGETATVVADTWTSALTKHEEANANIIAGVDRSLAAFGATFEQRSAALVEAVSGAYTSLQKDHAERDAQQQQAWAQSLEAMAAALAGELKQTGEQTLSQQQHICDALTTSVREITAQAQATTQDALAEVTRMVTTAEALMQSRIAGEAQWMAQHRDRMDQLAGLLRSELGTLRDEEAARAGAAVERLSALHAAVESHLANLGKALEEPITRLIHTASEAPRAAAEVIGQMRQEISNSVARDNELLDERARIMDTLNALLEAINHASAEQRTVIDSLVASSATALDATTSAFRENVAAESGRLSDIAAQVGTSAVEVSSLSEAFAFAVKSFNDANEKLIANLDRIEGVMDKSLSRSDEQVAYYVAQAREIIDLSMMSQKEIVDALRRLPVKQTVLDEAA